MKKKQKKLQKNRKLKKYKKKTFTSKSTKKIRKSIKKSKKLNRTKKKSKRYKQFKIKKNQKIYKTKKAKKDSLALKLVKLQLSLRPQFNFKINFSLEKYIQSFFDKISDTISNYKILKDDEKRRIKLEKIENERKEKIAIEKQKKEEEILRLKQEENNSKVKIVKPPILNDLSWTGSKTELVELLYGLNAAGAIRNGQAEMKKLVEVCKELFGIDLGNIYKTYSEIKLRENEPTKFLDLMKNRLLQKMQIE